MIAQRGIKLVRVDALQLRRPHICYRGRNSPLYVLDRGSLMTQFGCSPRRQESSGAKGKADIRPTEKADPKLTQGGKPSRGMPNDGISGLARLPRHFRLVHRLRSIKNELH